MVLSGCALPARSASAATTTLEEIYVLRSIREQQALPEQKAFPEQQGLREQQTLREQEVLHEQQAPSGNWCSSARSGFEPFPQDAERFFSFWSLELRPEDGKVVDARRTRVAELRACFGPGSEPAQQNFYAEVQLRSISFRGRGECLALAIDFPEEGLFPVRCQLTLSDLPAPYVGGLLTTNTVTSRAAFGGDTDPPGYTQASIATIRLWKSVAVARSARGVDVDGRQSR